MASLTAFVQAVTQFITGPFGISLIVIAVCAMFLAAMFRAVPVMSGFVALFLGACAMSAAWAVNTFLGGGGGI